MGRPRTDIQPRILHAARARFVRDGVDGASLRTIARDAKTSIGMIFYYYPTKDELFLAVVEEVYAKLVADLEALLAPDGAGSGATPVRERLRRAFARLGAATPEEIDILRIVVHEALLSSPRFTLVLERFRRGHIAALFAALAEGTANGEIAAHLPLPLLLAVTFGVGGVPQVVRRIAGSEPPFSTLPPPEALADLLCEVLFHGIGPRDPPTPPPRA